jgi:hypothetical protein
MVNIVLTKLFGYNIFNPIILPIFVRISPAVFPDNPREGRFYEGFTFYGERI